MKESLNDEIDKHQEELFKEFNNRQKMSKAKQDFDEIDNLNGKVKLDTLENSLRLAVESIQEIFDLSFRINFRESAYNFEKIQPIGDIDFEINSALTATHWTYKSDEFDDKKFRCSYTWQHMDEVEDLKYLGDGRLVSCSGDQTVKMWNINDGSCMQSFNAEAYKLFVMSNERLIAALERPYRLKIWNLSSFEALECRSKGMIECFEELGDDLIVYSEWVHDDYTHNIIYCKVGSTAIERVASIDQAHEDTIHCLQALSNGFLASGSDDGCIKVWNKELVLERVFQHRDHWVNELKLLPGDILASGSNDRTIRLWNFKTGLCVRKIKPGGEVQKMQVLPNGCLACLIIQ